jgi:hypothetical protein
MIVCKRDFADVIKLRVLWGDDPGLLGGPDAVTTVLIRLMLRRSSSEGQATW